MRRRPPPVVVARRLRMSSSELILNDDCDAVRGTRDGRAARLSESSVLVDSEQCHVRHAAPVRLHNRE